MKKIIPLFFAVDDNYIKFLSITLKSILDNASDDYDYQAIVLNAGLREESKRSLDKYNTENFRVEFCDVSLNLQRIASDLSIRDYYTKTTYFRLFIANLFPQFDKAIYLDCDMVVLGDISKAYETNLGDNLVGAVPDASVQCVKPFIEYVELGLGIRHEDYFNAGFLLMNLKAFREEDFEGQFLHLLKTYQFRVAQDQDYLNVLTAGRVTYLDSSWNTMPFGTKTTPNLIHYNLTYKPWKYDHILYEEYFWDYAEKAGVIEEVLELKKNFTPAMAKRDKEGGAKLMVMAHEEAYDENNYYRTYMAENNFFAKLLGDLRSLLKPSYRN